MCLPEGLVWKSLQAIWPRGCWDSNGLRKQQLGWILDVPHRPQGQVVERVTHWVSLRLPERPSLVSPVKMFSLSTPARRAVELGLSGRCAGNMRLGSLGLVQSSLSPPASSVYGRAATPNRPWLGTTRFCSSLEESVFWMPTPCYIRILNEFYSFFKLL